MKIRSRSRQTETPPDNTGGISADFLATLDDVMRRVADGDLQIRMDQVEDADEQRIADRLNHLLDVIDAFVRESGATLTAASQGRFHRRFLRRGLPGDLRAGATTIDKARAAMQATSQQLTQEEENRAQVANTALEISTQLAGAATELSASAGSLASTAGAAVSQTEAALSTVETLEAASTQIQEAVTLISGVAKQTRMLSLNATIEAARAGEAGRGFAVVANEVRSLADTSASSSADIGTQVVAAQTAAAEAAAVITTISRAIKEIDAQVVGIAEAAGGHGGLATLAETLRSEIGRVAS
jgi:methyl-accepting chemotaxis protein